MANIKSVSGVMCAVKDLDETVSFYQMLGFNFKKRTDDFAIGYINWFWVEFVPKEKVEKSTFLEHAGHNVAEKGAGVFLHMSVDNVDEYYHMVIEKVLKPDCEPKDFAWGRREFILTDPDGYKLVFFAKI